jgi:hypothetical protein
MRERQFYACYAPVGGDLCSAPSTVSHRLIAHYTTLHGRAQKGNAAAVRNAQYISLTIAVTVGGYCTLPVGVLFVKYFFGAC